MDFYGCKAVSEVVGYFIFIFSLTSIKIHPTGPFQPKTPHPLQILLVKLTFLPQKHIPYCPNHCGIEGGRESSEEQWPEERGPNLEDSNILNLIQRGPFRYLLM